MTDLEMTRFCAEAIADESVIRDGKIFARWERTVGQETICSEIRYDPLHDDAQAMALVKKLDLEIWREPNPEVSAWAVSQANHDGNDFSVSDNLNRAICECVAKMQKEKKP